VYKLVELEGEARIKVSEDIGKMVVPGSKTVYRLYCADGDMMDLICLAEEEVRPDTEVPCRAIPIGSDRILVDAEVETALIVPTKVEKLHTCIWDGAVVDDFPSLDQCKLRCKEQIESLGREYTHEMPPKKYKVYLSVRLYNLMITLWQRENPNAK